MDGRSDGFMDIWMDELTYGRTAAWMHSCMDE